MSDISYSYFSEMEKMSIPDLKELIERAKTLLFKKEEKQKQNDEIDLFMSEICSKKSTIIKPKRNLRQTLSEIETLNVDKKMIDELRSKDIL